MWQVFKAYHVAAELEQIAISRDFSKRISAKPSGRLGGIVRSLNVLLAEAEARDRELHLKIDELTDARDDAQTTNQMLRRLKNEIKTRSIERDTAMRRAEAANEAKSQFLANMSHEIRTPMHGILGLADVLSRTNLEARQTGIVQSMIRSGRGLLAIINDVLDFSKIESGRFELLPRPFSLRANVDDLTSELQPRFEKKGLELVVRIDESVPDMLVGDVGRIKQVLCNLIDNGLKYTEEGFVLLDISGQVLRDKVVLNVAVQDTGIGIPSEKIRSVFEKFNQVDNSSTRRHEGTGLGLAICRMLVEKMGGTVEASSEIANGSTFTVTMELPIHERPSAAIAAVSASAASVKAHELPNLAAADDNVVSLSGAEFQRISVLVVEDNMVNQEVAKGYLGEMGCVVTLAENGKVAVNSFGADTFNLIFMDCQMPEMDGFQATKLIRDAERRSGQGATPIIALTASAYDSDRKKCLAAGMNDFLSKPFSYEQLERVYRKWLPNGAEETAKAAKDAAALGA